ncbi:ribonuclease R [Sulfobacillus thermosulfidooxidans]|uniref:ribonuclease R n=1 Tax=Sulfobacillus thermosulfidooxidans TaxID=28034 RepID=UPI0004100FE6|nr:ribonuclease R [Sulfobacillus thermosulfidooxidans]
MPKKKKVVHQRPRHHLSPKTQGAHADPKRLPERIFAILANGQPLLEEQLLKKLNKGRSPDKSLFRIYAQYRKEGWLVRTESGHISILVRPGHLRINPRGFGFVMNSEYPQDDIFVPARWFQGARHDDEVLVWYRKTPDGLEGRVMDVLSRATTQVTGRLDRNRMGWRVIPDDPRKPEVEVVVPKHEKVRPGDMVQATITEWPLDPRRSVRGELTKNLGNPFMPGVDVSVVALEHHLPLEFPPAVLKAAELLPAKVRPEDYEGRLDLTDELIVTIDGADAKDLDDAISVKALDHGLFEVGVHIADVSYYVEENSPLDLEAMERGTSVYLVDRVIPMLPERLSNGIASLNPGIPRLTVSAIMTMDATGEVQHVEFHRSVIRSKFRLTYEGVNALLANQQDDVHHLRPFLETALTVRNILRNRRIARGAIDFDVPESKVILDANGFPVDVVLRERGLAESIIEELMLLANEVVAREMIDKNLPGLFRVHEPPGERMEQFREMIGALGYRLPESLTPKHLQDLINRVQDKPEERVVNTALLRAMKQARYQSENTGHFGLAADEYTHFTSPIRRYPDLWVHRVLTTYLEGRLDEQTLSRWRSKVSVVGEVSSVREREAMDAERDSVALKEAQFMADKLGEQYDAVISGVTNFGLFVELPNLIEGLVRLEDLPSDYWVFDPVRYRLKGQRTGREYQLGQTVRAEVIRVDVAMKRIDFRLVQDNESRIKPKRRQKV